MIAGGTGFLGSPLAASLVAEGHDVVILTRGGGSAGGAAGRFIVWNPGGLAGSWAEAIDGAGAVVNLAGESIGARRWSEAQKKRILESRLLATRSLSEAIAQARTPQTP